MAIPLILDCDPGHDDAMALLLAVADPAVDLLAVTTVAGNQTVEKCTVNARRVLSLAGAVDVPVARGAARPLARPLRIADDVHGVTGLDGPRFEGEPAVPESPLTAHELLLEVLREHDGPVTIVATGALTNVARLLSDRPDLSGRIDQIVWMGGSTERGNVTPYAEANAFVDPEAADQVLRSGLPFTMCGLNVTHQALVTDDVLAAFARIGTPLAEICVEWMTFFASTYRQLWGFDAPPLHDPVAVARVIDPSSVRCVEANVVVETAGRWTAGATAVDLHGYTGRPANAQVAMELDRAAFWARLIAAVTALS
ncbi:purine nucleosidase/pyrimidine-specific ribonucleoside hydrolase [Kribbella orskensis]|uniref:Purine nucleosidase/pyrimidine-specific ribonucleoside hydrolase n=1 Tax=Kribbella orskensis TaxID=2512216 RepID=A0ABY2BMM4_9ACTN|nr:MULTISPECIES: nucleoside hydrolase [Kribbella]TCN41798.1 purine nucleosidase/pyrimidine-specific ribonucleoside hydrolase [Kribbella sp. VKM Ac-2500]TCO25676.1 purine nucleosidase/pyrimidine-specific ribonucleoside hydrolase [Kribbella orskensis]